MHRLLDPVNEKDDCFHELIEECRYALPGARLSYSLRKRLEKFPPEARREIVNRIKVGCSPLFVACKKGQKEIAEYLITECQADMEQRGLYEVPDDRLVFTKFNKDVITENRIYELLYCKFLSIFTNYRVVYLP